MVDEVEESNRPRGLSDFFCHRLTISQFVAPNPRRVDHRDLLQRCRNIGVEAEDLPIVECDGLWAVVRRGYDGCLRHLVFYSHEEYSVEHSRLAGLSLSLKGLCAFVSRTLASKRAPLPRR